MDGRGRTATRAATSWRGSRLTASPVSRASTRLCHITLAGAGVAHSTYCHTWLHCRAAFWRILLVLLFRLCLRIVHCAHLPGLPRLGAAFTTTWRITCLHRPAFLPQHIARLAALPILGGRAWASVRCLLPKAALIRQSASTCTCESSRSSIL